MRFDADAQPLPEPSSPRRGVVPVLGVFAVVIASFGWAGWWLLTADMPARGSAPHSAPGSSVSAVSSTYPAELLQMAVAVSTSLAATATPPNPTPTYALLPSPIPVAICLTSTPKGETCTQPLAPNPTATPVLPCPVRPMQPCIHGGGAVTWMPTPTPALSTTSGSSS